jgi:hypothetical protein
MADSARIRAEVAHLAAKESAGPAAMKESAGPAEE